MDAIFPYLVRRTPAAEPSQRLIEPVTKYTRFSPDEHGHHHEIWQYRISGRQEQSRQQQQSQQQSEQQPQQTKPGEPQYLPTSHAVTPEADQHADADGHLDIYV
ncbi:hypothetical protein [Rheinheimera texasensis]|jgi:hypothetical protein|uniref:hypothetical protein n=1 Tax=Rheinheimera texasensis TaxID=306205 RepID=UPI0004E1E9CA|nr:hypothetical protein [Rheinheimera texasensis]